ncbi:MAG: HAD-IA family hydrolase [Bacteroidales bacterium]
MSHPAATQPTPSHSPFQGFLPLEELIKVNGIEGKVTVDEILQGKLEEFLKVQHLVPPIQPVVEIAKKYHGKLPMAVGTGGHRQAVERTLEVIGMREYFEVVVTANDVERHKPNPDTFLRCAEQMGVAPEYIEVFEDGDLGIEAALRAGMIPTDVRSWYNSDW